MPCRGDGPRWPRRQQRRPSAALAWARSPPLPQHRPRPSRCQLPAAGWENPSQATQRAAQEVSAPSLSWHQEARGRAAGHRHLEGRGARGVGRLGTGMPAPSLLSASGRKAGLVPGRGVTRCLGQAWQEQDRGGSPHLLILPPCSAEGGVAPIGPAQGVHVLAVPGH